MKLVSFRVTEFRSVNDSGWIDAEDVTTLIGTNESGKTNILLPLWKLNPADEGAIDLKADLPRDKYHVYREANPKPIFISAKYELQQAEKDALSTLSDHESDEFSEVIVSKNFDGNLFWEFPCEKGIDPDLKKRVEEALLTCKKAIEDNRLSDNKAENERCERALALVESARLSLESTDSIVDSIKRAFSELEKFEDDVKASSACTAMQSASQELDAIIDEASKPKLSDSAEVKDYLTENMPKYVYYSNYGNLDSQIYLPRVLEDIDKKNLGVKDAAKARTLKTLFKFVKLSPKEITALGSETVPNPTPEQIEKIADKKKEREILLSSASSSFTKSFNEWWKQGNYTFEFQADGNFFRIWVSDAVRPERIELESRSTGLQWFFSFYLVFLVESELHHQNAILLFDEPGVTLHPLAQKDLFLFFENLAENNQIMYTTHSPFMVDSNHLERVRSVYIDSNGKTVVSPDLRASERINGKNQPHSIYPAHAALGLSVSDTLLVNCNPVLVEGESDQVYLSAFKSLLISKGKIAPLKEIVFIPTGGVKGIKATAAILSGVNEVRPPVIVDGDKPGLKVATELKADFYAADQDKIINVSQFTTLPAGEVEDILPKDKFAKFIARFLPRPEEVDEEFDDVVVEKEPICNQVENYAKSHGISLEQGWKVKLATIVKREILKGTDKVVSEKDAEFAKIVGLFEKL